MNDITRVAYHKEIADLATNLIDELMAELDNNVDSVEGVIYDRVSEAVDSHEWIIYYYHNAFVTRFSGNGEAYLEVYDNESLGDIVAEKGPEGLGTVIAYFAMSSDLRLRCEEVLEEVGEAREEAEEAREAAEEAKELEEERLADEAMLREE